MVFQAPLSWRSRTISIDCVCAGRAAAANAAMHRRRSIGLLVLQFDVRDDAAAGLADDVYGALGNAGFGGLLCGRDGLDDQVARVGVAQAGDEGVVDRARLSPR